MSQPTAVIKVICKPDKLEETANLLAWTVGHRVEIADATATAETRWLFVFTDLAYHHDDDTILEHLGLDIIGKLGGVLSWTVIPSDQEEEQKRPQPASAAAAQPRGLEERLTHILSELPVPVSVMKRSSGKYAWKWQDATGQADTFVEAVMAGLALAMRSYKSVQGELHVGATTHQGDPEAALATELMNELVTLPAPVVIMQMNNGKYMWRWDETTGQAETFDDAVTSGLTLAMTSYTIARSKLIGS